MDEEQLERLRMAAITDADPIRQTLAVETLVAEVRRLRADLACERVRLNGAQERAQLLLRAYHSAIGTVIGTREPSTGAASGVDAELWA